MITPHNALHLILKHARPLETVCKPLNEVLGLCLAEDIRADRDLPPADRSAMDGYALRSADLTGSPRTLRLTGEVPAGSPARPRVRPGTCVRVLTGANIPPGADTVVVVEQTEETDGVVIFKKRVNSGSNILRRGEDAKKGTPLLFKGTVLGALQIGLCAAVGKANVKVYRHPRIALLCTGEELRGVSARVARHELRNSNGPALCAAIKNWGYIDITEDAAPDDVKILVSKLRLMMAKHDVILLTGGVSAGKYDFVPEAVERIGATIRFRGVAMKPGKPLLYATLPGNRHIFGLPGNPLSTMVGFYEFVLAALGRMSGLAADTIRPPMYVPLSTRAVSKGGRVRFVLARLLRRKNGLKVEPVRSHSSADLVAGGQADGVIVVPARAREISVGDLVEFRPWRPIL